MDPIPSLPSEMIGYCLTWMVMAPEVSCTMVGGRCLTRLGGLSSAQTVGVSFFNCSFSSSSMSYIDSWKRRYSLFKRQMNIRPVARFPVSSLDISPNPENKIVVWSLFRRSLPSKGNGHSGITMKKKMSHGSFS